MHRPSPTHATLFTLSTVYLNLCMVRCLYLAALPTRGHQRIIEDAKQRLSLENPLVARSPDSAAYEAILNENMRDTAIAEYPSQFNEQRTALWARADGVEDDL